MPSSPAGPASLLDQTLVHTGGATASRILPWGLLALGLCIAYVPTIVDLLGTLWRTEQNAHGPIVLLIGLGFLVLKARDVSSALCMQSKASTACGVLLLTLGLATYVIGRSQTVYALAIGSLIPTLAAIVLIFFGPRVLRRLWFGFVFLLFMIPLPGSVVDILTQPLKIVVSYGAEQFLYALNYPISRAGVILNMGHYQLLVADACAGLNSLFTLEALGLLYVNLTRQESAARNTLLALLIVPISITSNIIRVIVLALVTFHFGDAAGQGFVHGFSGMVLFITALLLTIAIDSALRTTLRFKRSKGIAP